MIHGIELYPVKKHCDDRGWLMEVLRKGTVKPESIAQLNVTYSHPGVIKAFHWHRNQDDYWCVLKGMAQVVLFDNRVDSHTAGQTQVIYLGEDNMQCLKIPRGVVHGYRVLGHAPVMLLYAVTQEYNPQEPDEERLAWNDRDIAFDWETQHR